MRKYLPDPFVFAIALTLLTVLLAIGVEGKSLTAMTTAWGKGFWSLLAFTTQMAVILAMGYVLATAPLTDRLLDRIVSHVHQPRTAIIVATLVGGIGSYLNWGFGLVIGGVVAKKLALKVKGVHYPLIIAAAYSGFTMYGLGLSASIPVLVATPGHPTAGQMGVIPLTQTIFSVPMLITSLVIIVTLPLLNAWLHPKLGDKVVEVDPPSTATRRRRRRRRHAGKEHHRHPPEQQPHPEPTDRPDGRGLRGAALHWRRFAGPEPDQLHHPVPGHHPAGHAGRLRGQADRRHQDHLRDHPAVPVLRRHHGHHGGLGPGDDHFEDLRRRGHARDAALLGPDQLLRHQLLRAFAGGTG